MQDAHVIAYISYHIDRLLGSLSNDYRNTYYRAALGRLTEGNTSLIATTFR